MAFSESEAKVVAALSISRTSRTVHELCTLTLIPSRAVRNILKRLDYDGFARDYRDGWIITNRGHRSIEARAYADILTEIRSRE